MSALCAKSLCDGQHCRGQGGEDRDPGEFGAGEEMAGSGSSEGEGRREP